MNTWNKDELERILALTGSMTETAKHFDVSRERIRQVAHRDIGRDRLIELGIALHGVYSTCQNCATQITGITRKRCAKCALFYSKHGIERTDELVRQFRIEAQRKARHHQPWTHCSKGHPLSGDNLYVSPKGSRQCQICRRARSRKAMADPKYLERQREHVRAYQRRNREAIRERNRHRYATDPEYRARMQTHDRKRRERERAARLNRD